MKLPDKTVKILLRLISGETIPASSAKSTFIDELIAEKILWQKGKHRKTIQLIDEKSLSDYLYNHYGIRDLKRYHSASSRSEFTVAGTDSKHSAERVFKGFLVNCYDSISAELNGDDFIINPDNGSFVFIYDYESFRVPENVTIVGVENAMNFRFISEQAYLFKEINPLFISRYPQSQSNDFIAWIKSVPNKYLHFGDFDIAGIGIYLNEYKKQIGERARFFIPPNIESAIKEYGNRERFDTQRINFTLEKLEEEELVHLVEIINREQKGLDQEFYIR